MTCLENILQLRRRDVAEEKAAGGFDSLQRRALLRKDQRDFRAAVNSRNLAIVAEIKRASPSRGVIRSTCDVAHMATRLSSGGAAALSVLTEARHFHGSFEDLSRVRNAVTLPVLCKDFIVDEFQVWKAGAYGADAVLFILSALSDDELASLLKLASTLRMDSLVEVHSVAEAGRALRAGATLIGVNNRNLHSFGVDIQTALQLRPHIPPSCVVIAESGYTAAHELRAAAAAGMAAVLIGEALMRAHGDPAVRVRALLGDVACSG